MPVCATTSSTSLVVSVGLACNHRAMAPAAAGAAIDVPVLQFHG